MAEEKQFGIPDYVIFVLTLVISAGIGLFYAWRDKRRQSTENFLLGGRQMSIFPVTLSLMASFLSAVLVLGVPTEIYYHGTMYWVISFSNILTFPVAVHAFLPVFHRLEISSAYEYLEVRFSKTIRTMGCIVFQVQMLLYMAVVLYAPALALNQVMGFSMLLSILVIGLVCTFYTAIGGLKAVMWTDAFQMIIVFIGLLALVIKATVEVGGFNHVWETAKQAGKLQADNFNTSPFERHTFWTLVVGGFVTSMTIYGSNQAMIQRYLSMRSCRSAQAALYWNLPASLIFTTLLVYVGLVLFARYGTNDPVGCIIQRRDQMIPWLVMDVLGDYAGFPGLMVACIFSASLSTVSSGVNALALTFMTDVFRPLHHFFTKSTINERRATLYSKLIALIFGFLTIGMAFLSEKMGPLILQIALSIFGMVGGPLLSLFVMAMFIPCVNSWGAGAGLICSLVFTFWLAISAIVHRPSPPPPICRNDVTSALNSTSIANLFSTSSSVLQSSTLTESTLSLESGGTWNEIYNISYLWYSSIAVIVGVTVAIIVSLITGGTRRKPVDRRLLSPLYLYLSSFAVFQQFSERQDQLLEKREAVGNGVASLRQTVDVNTNENVL
ncbi:sodium-dependent multivitamin transporter-like [Crassostrea angulata]|uniref:sodium-dependent multivitamin transporter-like n=1 Tax=Magallana angulata TaxID=2784310 RepID=UPI0022B0A88E|nr:sodium-dependent multivitamin transporter-like [Crassostrea angulata]